MKTQGKFRKKPIEIDAIQYTGSNFFDVADWIRSFRVNPRDIISQENTTLIVQTLENKMDAYPGWYIIRGVKGEFYSCEPEIFELTYEEVEENDDVPLSDKENTLTEAVFLIKLMIAQQVAENMVPGALAELARVSLLAKMYDFIKQFEGKDYTAEELIDWADEETGRLVMEMVDDDGTSRDLDDVWKDALS